MQGGISAARMQQIEEELKTQQASTLSDSHCFSVCFWLLTNPRGDAQAALKDVNKKIKIEDIKRAKKRGACQLIHYVAGRSSLIRRHDFETNAFAPAKFPTSSDYRR